MLLILYYIRDNRIKDLNIKNTECAKDRDLH